jgi:hypothetical protein
MISSSQLRAYADELQTISGMMSEVARLRDAIRHLGPEKAIGNQQREPDGNGSQPSSHLAPP